MKNARTGQLGRIGIEQKTRGGRERQEARRGVRRVLPQPGRVDGLGCHGLGKRKRPVARNGHGLGHRQDFRHLGGLRARGLRDARGVHTPMLNVGALGARLVDHRGVYRIRSDAIHGQTAVHGRNAGAIPNQPRGVARAAVNVARVERGHVVDRRLRSLVGRRRHRRSLAARPRGRPKAARQVFGYQSRAAPTLQFLLLLFDHDFCAVQHIVCRLRGASHARGALHRGLFRLPSLFAFAHRPTARPRRLGRRLQLFFGQ